MIELNYKKISQAIITNEKRVLELTKELNIRVDEATKWFNGEIEKLKQ